jgi:hypothetical protein
LIDKRSGAYSSSPSGSTAFPSVKDKSPPIHMWTLREPMKETTTHLEEIPELQIPLLVEALMKKGVIKKENQARRRYYWRKELDDI